MGRLKLWHFENLLRLYGDISLYFVRHEWVATIFQRSMSSNRNRILPVKRNRRRKKSISLNGSGHQFNYNGKYLSTNLVKIVKDIYLSNLHN